MRLNPISIFSGVFFIGLALGASSDQSVVVTESIRGYENNDIAPGKVPQTVTVPPGSFKLLGQSPVGKLILVGDKAVTVGPGTCFPNDSTQKITEQSCKGTYFTQLPIPKDDGKDETSQPIPPSRPPSAPPIDSSAPPAVQALALPAQIADETQRIELAESALASKEAIQRSIASDEAKLAQVYADIPPAELGSYFERAKRNISKTVEVLNSAAKNDDSGEALRFRNLYMNAKDKAELGSQILQDELKQDPTPLTPPSGVISPAVALAKTQGLNDLFGAFDSTKKEIKPVSQQDALSNRMLMLAGLPDKQRAEAMKKLQLIEPLKVNLPDGTKASVPVLHNGYIWGGGKTGVDCSSFVSSLLPGNENATRFTTFDFAAMWELLESGRIPKPPYVYKKDREKLIRKSAEGFTAINLYMGEPLAVGDLLVFRMPWVPVGHVFVVRSYNAQDKVARVIEAGQTLGTVYEREFPLSLDPTSAQRRLIRPGLMGLRLKQTDNATCQYRDSKGKRKRLKHG